MAHLTHSTQHHYSRFDSISKTTMIIIVVIVVAVAATTCASQQQQEQLRVGFYSQTCPDAEFVVRSTVRQAVNQNPALAPALLRLHFHDCFVEGCDASILINRDSPDDEKRAVPHQGVNGFQVIEAAKEQLEGICRGVVSCSDIVAMAARDAVAMSFGPDYSVETGRRDGLVSEKSLAFDMPDVDDSIQVLKAKFSRKGLNPTDLVLLSAAHTIGTTACFFMRARLHNFTGTSGAADPSLDTSFLRHLRSRCPFGGDVNVRIPMDPFTPDRFDDLILRNVRFGFAVIASDARLADDEETRGVVGFYLGNPGRFMADFATAMVRMGRVGVVVQREGEVEEGGGGKVRRVCRLFN